MSAFGMSGANCCGFAEEQKPVRHASHKPGIVHFNNPKLFSDLVKSSDSEYTVSNVEEKANPRQIGGIVIVDESRFLGSKLRMLGNNEIGVTTMQRIYDTLQYTDFKQNLTSKVEEISGQLLKRFSAYLKLLRTVKITVENLYRFHKIQPMNHRHDCCSLATSRLRWDKLYKTKVTSETTCDLVPPGVQSDVFNPGQNLTEVFQHNTQYMSGLKWQYFISTTGIHNEFPAHRFSGVPYSECANKHDTRHREIYVSSVYPQRKNIVIVIDRGNSLSQNQMHTAKAIAKFVLLSLSENDRVAVIGLSSEVSYVHQGDCLSSLMVPLTYEIRLQFTDFIDKLEKDKTATNHLLGFRTAFSLIWNSLSPDNITAPTEQAMIVYISRGLLSSLTEARDVIDAISVDNAFTGHRVVINTYAVIDAGKPIMYEKSFLQDIAVQNSSKYAVPVRHTASVPRGVMVAVNSSRDLTSTVGDFLKSFKWTTSNKPHVSRPFHDTASKGMLMAVTWPCFYDGKMLGVAGLDIQLGELLEGITYFPGDGSIYAFLIDGNGKTVMHPSLQQPILTAVQPMYADISYYEQHPGFSEIRHHILGQEVGTQTLEVPHGNTSQHDGHLSAVTRLEYTWKQINIKQLAVDRRFVIVIKSMQEQVLHRQLKTVAVPGPPHLVYHRLDMLPTDHSCIYLKQLATFDSSALFLAAIAFQKPFEHLTHDVTKRTVLGYLAYLKDNTNLISNPGVREDVRKDVAVVSQINDSWMKQVSISALNDYIIRRYVATPSGVFMMYPGTLLSKSYDPTHRDWYTRATEFPGKVTLTAPYLDVGGAGYIVTISHTIFEGKHASTPGRLDRVAAVMAIDVTLGYFYKLLVEQLPACQHDNIRCFVMDDRGYLIAHQGLIEPNGKGPLEQQHITHKEPLVANDILNHRGFVHKQLCKSYNDRTTQRFYHFNTSIDRVLTNLVHGEHCSRYQVTVIPGTNAFFGIVNETCPMMIAFCPCSMVDRLCLNCHRMEQSECECPCECPLDISYCNGTAQPAQHSIASCTHHSPPAELMTVSAEAAESLPQCVNTHCSQRRTKMECLGRVCFAGVLGAATPYRDEVSITEERNPALKCYSSPVGPVAGGIMGCFLVLAIAIYCYRRRVHRRTQLEYMTAGPDAHSAHPDLARIDSLDELDSGHTNIVLATFDSPASVSPYRMNTMYRRPTNTESDHGYSTMTPHDDSEQASTTCLEPLIIARDRYRPSTHMAGSTTTPMLPPPPGSRRSRSPTPPQTQLPSNTNEHQTMLPNQILANVQVHMVDTH
ncbi:VWFA and cache domain-containing protein 1 [Lamellibrachia satsuma]|nr:VWFA and cache domain-containing protein 1 [Lamellibrachia satsuma]